MAMQRWQWWALILTAVAIFANLPRHLGPLKAFVWQAGFPFLFIWGTGNESTLKLPPLALDVLIWLAVTSTACVFISRSHRRSRAQTKHSLPS